MKKFFNRHVKKIKLNPLQEVLVSVCGTLPRNTKIQHWGESHNATFTIYLYCRYITPAFSHCNQSKRLVLIIICVGYSVSLLLKKNIPKNIKEVVIANGFDPKIIDTLENKIRFKIKVNSSSTFSTEAQNGDLSHISLSLFSTVLSVSVVIAFKLWSNFNDKCSKIEKSMKLAVIIVIKSTWPTWNPLWPLWPV